MSDNGNSLAVAREKTPIAIGQRGIVLKDHGEMFALAGAISKTKACPQGYTQDDVFIALQTGSEFGFTPIRALHAIPVIKGRPTLEGKAMLALIQAGGFDDPRGPIAVGCDGEGDQRVGWCSSWRHGWPEARTTEFTWKQAVDAGLTKPRGGAPSIYTLYGEDMLIWKAVNRHCNRNYADVTHGLMLEITGQEVYGAPGITVATHDAEFQSEPTAADPLLSLPQSTVPEEAVVVTGSTGAPEELPYEGSAVEYHVNHPGGTAGSTEERQALMAELISQEVAKPREGAILTDLTVPGTEEHVRSVREDKVDVEADSLTQEDRDAIADVALREIKPLKIDEPPPGAQELSDKVTEMRERTTGAALMSQRLSGHGAESTHPTHDLNYSVCGARDCEGGSRYCMWEEGHAQAGHSWAPESDAPDEDEPVNL